MTYVYPVLSRRAGGISVGINLNPNRACNWACIYCQVPGLRRGAAPAIDLDRLDSELAALLARLRDHEVMAELAPEGCRRIADLAISGDGEPTSARGFDAIVARIFARMRAEGLDVPLRLITNGSYVHKAQVARGIAAIGEGGGEVWIKVDRLTSAGIEAVNGVRLSPERLLGQVEACARLAPTWIQTCLFAMDGRPPPEAELSAIERGVAELLERGVRLSGMLLYGLARPSMQPGGARLSALPREDLEAFADRIRALGLAVSVHP